MVAVTPVETTIIGRGAGMLWSLVGSLQRRKHAKQWEGEWEAYDLVGRDLSQRMANAGPTRVTLSGWFSPKLTFACYDCDATGTPTRYQAGTIRLDPDDPNIATRTGHYLDCVEVYEQRLRMIDKNTIVILPVPSGSSLGDVYGKHGWRRKR